ncbi:MAG: hypothetical protein Q8P54_02760 [bacterium]|nr:hypothetical protein [bacterium]
MLANINNWSNNTCVHKELHLYQGVVMGYHVISDEEFESALKELLGDYYSRAFEVSQKCGRFLTFDIINTLMWASDKGKVEEVLDALEAHWQEHLVFQHPDIRGTVSDADGYNPTHAELRRICEKILQLEPEQLPGS